LFDIQAKPPHWHWASPGLLIYNTFPKGFGVAGLEATVVRHMDGWQTEVVVVTSPDTRVSAAVALTVLLPAYNEEEAIWEVLEEIVEALGREEAPSYEILVVDDASTDRTAEMAEAFAAQCPQCPVRVIRRPTRGGAGAARKVGIRAARGGVVVMLDADGSYPAEAINDLLPHFPAYDQVNGARTSEQGTLPWLRRPAKWFIRKLACYLTGHRIPDLNTGLKAFKRDAMLPWLWVVPDGFSCVTTMTLAFLSNGYAVKYVPIEYRPRVGLSKFHPIKDTLSYFSTVLRMVLYFRPLKVFMPISGVITGLGVLKSVLSFQWTGSMQESDIVVITAGFMTCMLGLLAEVIVAHHRR
jgi:polyisoprenyl-phosphate glycosyltransferase